MGTRVPWVLAQPIQDLLDQDIKYSQFSNLGVEGNKPHLQKHGGHTPWRPGSKRGVIWAKDTHTPPEFKPWLLAKCRSNYETRWLRFFNLENGQYDAAGTYLGYSADGHFHAECDDGWETFHVTLFDDFIRETQGDAMDPRQEALVTGKLNSIIGMMLEGTSPTGTETTGGGVDRIYMYDHMNDDRDAVLAKLKDVENKLVAVEGKLVALPQVVRDAVAALKIDITPDDLQRLQDGIVAGVNRPQSGTWTTDPEV